MVVISSDDDDSDDLDHETSSKSVKKRRHSSNNSDMRSDNSLLSKKPRIGQNPKIIWPKNRDKSTWDDPKRDLIFSDIAKGLETGVDQIKVINTLDTEVPECHQYNQKSKSISARI